MMINIYSQDRIVRDVVLRLIRPAVLPNRDLDDLVIDDESPDVGISFRCRKFMELYFVCCVIFFVF